MSRASVPSHIRPPSAAIPPAANRSIRPLSAAIPPAANTPTSFADDETIETAVSASAAQAEPDPDLETEGALSVVTRVEYAALARGQTQDVFGLVTIQAVQLPSTPGQAERQPTDIICVLDVSGSMGGDKIQKLQAAVRFIIEQSDPRDRLSIVTFNTGAVRVLPLRRMTAEGRDAAKRVVMQLTAGGGTSIAAGLDTALAVLEQRRQRNKISAMLLLTDGNDPSTSSRVPALLKRASEVRSALYAFGFGDDHDAALLSEIAEQARTPFTFVEDAMNLQECFAGAVSGLSSIVAQNVELLLECHVPLKSLHTPFAVRRDGEMKATITIPDVFAEERRDILVELALPASADISTLLDASLRYTDLRRSIVVQTPVVGMEITRVEEPQPEMEPDEEVSAQRERVEVTRALQQAAQQGDAGQFEGAQGVLMAAEQSLKSKSKKNEVQHSLASGDRRCQSADAKPFRLGARRPGGVA